jgi:hypothetical protein
VTKPLKRALCAALLAALAPVSPAIAGSGSTADSAAVAALANIVPRTAGRSILIDAASAKLFMLVNGRLVDSLMVIVGMPA